MGALHNSRGGCDAHGLCAVDLLVEAFFFFGVDAPTVKRAGCAPHGISQRKETRSKLLDVNKRACTIPDAGWAPTRVVI